MALQIITDFFNCTHLIFHDELISITVTVVSQIFLSIAACGHLLATENSLPCHAKDYGHGSVVCVCSASYCDTLESPNRLPPGDFWKITSTKDGLRFMTEKLSRDEGDEEDHCDPHGNIPCAKSGRTATEKQSDEVSVILDPNSVLQTVVGFGGAFTDASGININSLSPSAKNHLIQSYFSPGKGIGYTVCRVPIAGTDFSTHPYTYSDSHIDDFQMEDFYLHPEDLKYKIPLIKKAGEQVGSNQPFRLIASPWGAPAWMKTNGKINGGTRLKGDLGGLYYQAYADYIVRFLHEYAKHNVSFWAVSPQNEPFLASYKFVKKFNSMEFSPEELTEFIGSNLGPTLKGHKDFANVLIIAYDDISIALLNYTEVLLGNASKAEPYISGLGIHWYGFMRLGGTGHEVLSEVHQRWPQHLLISTEACEGVLSPKHEKVLLGSWERAERYANDIIQHLRNWAVGWVDWNLALNLEGGPNWVDNRVDSPVIVDAASDRFYKQPMFYAMGHFSKFILPGSRIISTRIETKTPELDVVAAIRPDNATVVVLLNRSNDTRKVIFSGSDSAQDLASHEGVRTTLPARSVQTYIWWSE